MAYDKEAVRALLPKVGDRLMHTPHLHKSLGIPGARPRWCVVTMVNEEHGWYQVRFEETGFIECFKVPELNAKDVRYK